MVLWLWTPDAHVKFEFETFTTILEVIRRCVWNLFRLDNQQATNCEDYIVCKFIPLMQTEKERDDKRIDSHENGTEKECLIKNDGLLTDEKSSSYV